MQMKLSEAQCRGMVAHAPERAATVERDTGVDMKILPGQMIDAASGAVRENAPEFWESALRKLGHVSIFAFATGEFMLVGPGGERVRAGSLTAALREMLRCPGFDHGGREEDD